MYSERIAEEERRAAEEAASLAAEEEKKREEEERIRAQRAQREKERAEAAEKARLQTQREEEAMRNREARKKAERETSSAGTRDWRRSDAASSTPTPVASTPPTPSKSASATGPDRSGPPSPAPASRGRFIPSAQRAGASSWREREAAKNAVSSGTRPGLASGAASPLRPASPAVNQPVKESEGNDGFTTVQPKKWASSRVRQQKEQNQRQ